MNKVTNKKDCDNCGKENLIYYCSHTNGRLKGTFCEDCYSHIPPNFFGSGFDPNTPVSEEFTMMLLKFGNKK